MTPDFDRPRPIPPSVADAWRRSGLWTASTVSEVVGAQIDLDAPACVVDGERYTFGTLRHRSTTVAVDLARRGVARGDRVLIQLANSVELVAAITACWRLGAIAVPVVPMFRTHELISVVSQAGPAAVVAASVATGSRCPAAEVDAAVDAAGLAPLVRYHVGPQRPGWSPFPGGDHDEHDEHDGARLAGFDGPESCALILFTSGTTSEPKGVRHDSYSLLAEVNSYRRSASLCASDVIFNPAPISHIGALVVSLLVPWSVGCPVVLQSRWDPQRAIELIAQEKVTFAVGAPVFLTELVERYEAGDDGGHRLSEFQTGAAATSTSVLRRAATVGISAWRAWGMTEAPTISYGTASDPLDRRADTDGRIEPGSEVRAVDADGRLLPPGAEGELVLRSPKQMMGYLDARHDHSRPDGWLSTGDLGRVDADGWVCITGRVKDIINRGGEKFSCREIEDALASHPAVKAVAVLGVPEQRLGEQVIAYVTVRPEAGYPGPDALTAHLAGLRLAPQKHPVAIMVVEQLPMTPTGKVLKTELARRWLDGTG